MIRSITQNKTEKDNKGGPIITSLGYIEKRKLNRKIKKFRKKKYNFISHKVSETPDYILVICIAAQRGLDGAADWRIHWSSKRRERDG